MQRLFEKRGFTLIELLVGIAIFGIIAGSVYGTFSNAIRLNRRAHSAEGLYRDARWAVDILAEDLENMVAYHQRVDAAQIHTVRVNAATSKNIRVTQGNIIGDDFDGQVPGSVIGYSDNLSLIRRDDSGLKEIRYYLRQPDEVHIHRLMVNVQPRDSAAGITQSAQQGGRPMWLLRSQRPFPYLREEDGGEQHQEEILSRHVLADSLRFAYAAVPEGGTVFQDEMWEAEWLRDENPAAVQMEITFLNPAGDRQFAMRKRFVLPLALEESTPAF